MPFITDTQFEVKRLLGKFDRCSVDEQLMLLVLSVVYKPVHQTMLNLILGGLTDDGVFGKDQRVPAMAAKTRNRLKKDDLIEESSHGIRLNKYLHHSLTMKCIDNKMLATIINSANTFIPVRAHHSWGFRDPIEKETEFRQCLYLGQFNRCLEMIEINKDPQVIDLEHTDPLIDLCFYPYAHDFFLTLPVTLQYQAFATLMIRQREDLQDNTETIGALQLLFDGGHCNDHMKLLLAEQFLLRDDPHQAQLIIEQVPVSAYRLSLFGWVHFLQDDAMAAIACFEQSLVAKNKIARRVRQHVGDFPGVIYLLALLQAGYESDVTLFNKLFAEVNNYKANQRSDKHFLKCYETLDGMGRLLSGKSKKLREIDFRYYHYDEDYYFRLAVLIGALCFEWSREQPPEAYLERLADYCKAAKSSSSLWYARVAAKLLFSYNKRNLPAKNIITDDPGQTIDMLTMVKQKEAWLQALDQLIALRPDAADSAGQSAAINECRVVWLIHPYPPYKVEPKEQKMGKRGWTKGRAIALKRLRDSREEFDYLSQADHRMCNTIAKEAVWGHYGDRMEYSLSGYAALKACIGHPAAFSLENLNQPVDIIEAQPELMITESGDGYKINMPGLPEDADDFDEGETCFGFVALGGDRYSLTPFTGQHLEIADIVGRKGLKIPQKAKDKVLESIAVIAPLLNIQSDIAGIAEVETGIEEISPDHTLYINIQPAGSGLQMECHVQPLGEHGPNLLPGSGNSMVVAQIEDKRVMTNRVLALESRHLDLLIADCPMFAYMADHLLVLDDLEDALTCLEQLEALHQSEAEPQLVLQWPKGQELKLSKSVDAKEMSVTVGRQKDWFSVEGELTIGEDEVVDLKNLLTLMENSPGRFVRLEDNRFIALTEQLRQQLRDIAATAFNGKFHPLAAPLIEDATAGMKVKSNRVWQQQLKKLKQSFTITPQLPPTLQADLRDYQLDGFDWAYRLAHWGGGACLADDMGLGKTLQALAVILARAADGPALVLAPTSVCFNWQEEAVRFAPTLQVKMFGMSSKKDRQAMLEGAEPFDLIVCSYGLLQTEGEGLTAVDWHTIVADEAQAIKNPQAKRTQAAMALKGDFKMITTGTPIENNLTELWSLFRFINPGLLGSKEQFTSRFVNTIENADKDEGLRHEASQALRRMISPFILRRLKSEVLTELPSRTEINLHVELSREETTFYEALRQKAVENMMKSDAKPGQKRIKILAEIMRLRRACCHPSLVVSESEIEGSKLKVFDNLVDELLQGNHRALVFSQFVGHLDILRAHLKQKGISFQYLDGSTTPANRKKAVNAFQGGEGDLFLISLKAGGAGLNLTAADYVIHMDPWWNPAVEDQASDRAHRMGQTRPVTIYRLITQNTIEDKIVGLHQQKRDLANSLLEGTESAGSLSLDDMMNLLHETG